MRDFLARLLLCCAVAATLPGSCASAQRSSLRAGSSQPHAHPTGDPPTDDVGVDSGTWSSTGTITLGASSTGTAPVTTAWTIDSGGAGTFSDSTSATSTFAPDTCGTYVLRWTATNPAGSAFDTVSINATTDAAFISIVRGIGGSSLKALLYSDLGVTNDGSGRASAWADQSGNANNLAQTTAGMRPLIVAGADSHTALQGDNSRVIGTIDGFSGLSAGDHPVVYVVTEFTASDATGSFLLNLEASAAGDGIGIYHIGTSGTLASRVFLAGAPGNAQVTGAHDPPTGDPELIKVLVTSAGADSRNALYRNGSLLATSGSATAGNGLQNTLNDFEVLGVHYGEYHTGEVYFVAVFNAALSGANETRLHNSLEVKYPSIGALP